MIKKTFLILASLLWISIAWSQPLNFQRSFLDFFSIGARVSTNGWGLSFRKGFSVNRYTRRYYAIEITSIKDPRSIKFSNPYYITPENIFYGKVNDFFDLRVSYGRQNILVEKKDRRSLEIRIISSFGPALGFAKPVYYNAIDKTGSYTYETKFTEDLLLQQILNMAPFYKGLDEIKPNFGGYGKIGISFEHAKTEHGLSSLEVGATFTAYLLPVQLIYGHRQNFFVNLYIEYRLGKFYPSRVRHKEKTQPNEH